MKRAEEANRGKVRKEIGGKLNPGKLARPALLRGFRPFCEDFGGEGAHCPLLEGRGRTFRISTALKSAAYCFKQWAVRPIGCKCQFKDTHYHLFQWENGISLTSLSSIFWMNGNKFWRSIEKSFRKCGSVIKYKKSSQQIEQEYSNHVVLIFPVSFRIRNLIY